MNSPRISVVIPSYNQGSYLGTAIQSVIDQQYDNFEILVIDGSSDDNSVNVIQNYERHITYWTSEEDEGQSHAINKGFRRAEGDILCWLNADDVFFPSALSKIASLYSGNPGSDIFTGNIVYIDENGTVERCLRVPKMNWSFFRLGVGYFQDPAIFFTRDIIEEVGLLDIDLDYSMDQDLWHRFREQSALVTHTADYLGGFRLHEQSKTAGQISGDDEDYSFELPETTKVRKRYIPDIPKNVIILTRLAYKTRQCMNLNYAREWIDRKRLRGKHWDEVMWG